MEKTTRCRQCGVELPRLWSTDICLECSTKNVKAIFKEFPDVKKAFFESIEKMKKELED